MAEGDIEPRHSGEYYMASDGKPELLVRDRAGAGGARSTKAGKKVTITNTSETTIVDAGGANTYQDLYLLLISNTSSTEVNVTIKDDTAGTTRFIVQVPAKEVRGFALPKSSAYPQAVANKPWTATVSAGVSSIEITTLCSKNTT